VNSLKKFILEILEVINYEGDKERYVNNLISAISLKTYNRLCSQLKKEEKDKFKDLINNDNPDPREIEMTLREKFGEDIVRNELTKTAREVLEKYIKEILPSLSTNQIRQLDGLLSKYQPGKI